MRVETWPVLLELADGTVLREEYWFADVTRRLYALDIERLGILIDEAQVSQGGMKYPMYMPNVSAYALREDLPVAGVHLFREQIYGRLLFVSEPLRAACLAAGMKGVAFSPPERPDVPIG